MLSRLSGALCPNAGLSSARRISPTMRAAASSWPAHWLGNRQRPNRRSRRADLAPSPEEGLPGEGAGGVPADDKVRSHVVSRKENVMRLEIRRRGVKVTEELRAHVKERLRLALGRFAR